MGSGEDKRDRVIILYRSGAQEGRELAEELAFRLGNDRLLLLDLDHPEKITEEALRELLDLLTARWDAEGRLPMLIISRGVGKDNMEIIAFDGEVNCHAVLSALTLKRWTPTS